MKKFLCILMTLIMIFSMTTNVFASTFKDLDENHNQFEAIDTLKTLELIEGYEDGAFGGDNVLTRAELCTMMVRAMYEDNTHFSTNNIFTDVSIDHWARVYIDTAFENGLMVGYGDGTFGPENKLTYTQTARVILNALGYGDLEWPVGVNTFAYELGLYDNVKIKNFENGCTRADAAQMIYNAFDKEIVQEYAGKPFGTNTYFLKDILQFEKMKQLEYIDGHLYVAYKNLNDKDADLYITNVCKSVEKTIYPIGDNTFKFEDNARADVQTFDWAKVELFVNDMSNDDISFFTNVDSAIGAFDEDDNLLAIFVENEGKIWIDGVTGTIPANIFAKVEKDEDYNPLTSTVTYFEEDGTYTISNDFICGFVTDDSSSKYIEIDGVKHETKDSHNFKVDDFAVIYLDNNNKIAGFNTIEKPYHFNIKTMKYHTWECYHFNDRANDNNWIHSEEGIIDYYKNTDKAGTIVKFDACKDCHAEGKYSISII